MRLPPIPFPVWGGIERERGRAGWSAPDFFVSLLLLERVTSDDAQFTTGLGEGGQGPVEMFAGVCG